MTSREIALRDSRSIPHLFLIKALCLAAFIRKNGRMPSQVIDAEKHLYSWLKTQRQRRKKGDLEIERIRLLDTLAPKWSEPKAYKPVREPAKPLGWKKRSDETAREVAAWREKNGGLWPRSGGLQVSDEELRLGRAVVIWRVRHRKGKLNPNTIGALNYFIPGWDAVKLATRINVTIKPRYEECTALGCHAPHYGRGYCMKHYQRWKKGKLID